MSRLLPGVFASGGEELTIDSSVRFSGSNFPTLTRRETGSSSNTQTWTWSGWLKKSELGRTQIIFGSRTGTGSSYFLVFFNTNDQLQVLHDANGSIISNDTFRDTSSWYHIVIAADTTISTASERIKIYVNNRRITSFQEANYPTQNQSLYINSTNTQTISKNGPADQSIDGYMCEIHHVPVQQLTPESFGKYNEYGAWIPKQYIGSYTNQRGYYLPMHGSFKYAEDIGKDPRIDEGQAKGSDSVTNVSISTAQSKYGGSSIFFQNGASYIPRVRPFIDIGKKDFTVEAWIYPTTFAVESLFRRIWSVGTSLTNDFNVHLNTSGNLVFRNNDSIQLTSTTALVLNTWNHIAFVRNGTTIRFFVNGTASGSATFDVDLSEVGDNPLRIGNHPNGSASFNGYMNHFRVTVGFARYTDTYNEDIDAAEDKLFNPQDPHYHQVKLAIPGNGKNGDDFVQWYKYGTWDAHNFNGLEEITGGHVVGNSVMAGGIFKFGYSAVRILDAAADQVWFKTGTNAGTRFMYEGDFTIETWFYDESTSGDRSLYVQSLNSGGGPTYFALNIDNTNNRFNLYLNSGSPIQVSQTIPTGEWVHVALSRQGTGTNNLKLFYNGSVIYQTTNNTTLGYKDPGLHRLGGGVATGNWRVDNYRVYKGIGKYTSAFTPPTSEIPWDENDPNWTKVAVAICNDASQYSETVEVKYCNYNSQYVDLMYDTPINNRSTIMQTSLFGAGTVDDGGLRVNAGNDIMASFGVLSGKWYWESGINALGTGGQVAHWGIKSANSFGYENQFNIAGMEDDTYFYRNDNSSSWYRNGYNVTSVTSSGSGTTVGVGDLLRFELDMDSNPKTFKLYKNNSTTPMYTHQFTHDGVTPVFPIFRNNSNCETWANFGQHDFIGQIPEGYKTFCSENVPEPTVFPKEHFDVARYVGNGVNAPDANIVSGYQLSPNFIWIKNVSGAAQDNHLQNSLRGTGRFLVSNNLQLEQLTGGGDISSFNADGFTLSYANGRTNASGVVYDAYMWDAGSNAVTNTDGTIQTTVVANPSCGVSLIQWTGNGVENSTIGHGLGKKPRFIMMKNTSTSLNSWHGFYYNSLRSGAEVFTNNTVHIGNKDGGVFGWNYTGGGAWGGGQGAYGVDPQSNGNGAVYIAYCFTNIEGFSSIGSFRGNNSTNGTFVYTGFRPAFVMVRSSGEFFRSGSAISGSWNIMDYKGIGFNPYNYVTYPDLTASEQGYLPIDILSNGFKFRSTNTGSGAFNSANNFFYMAFAEVPFKYANAR